MSDFNPDELRRLERATAPYDADAPGPDAPGFVDHDQDTAALREGWKVATSILGAPRLLSIDERQLVRHVLKRSARRRVRQRALVAAMLLVCGAFAWGWRHDLPGPGKPVAMGPTTTATKSVGKTSSTVPNSQANQEGKPHQATIESASWDDDNVDEDLAEARQAFVQMQDEVRLSSGLVERLGRDLDALEEDLRQTKL